MKKSNITEEDIKKQLGISDFRTISKTKLKIIIMPPWQHQWLII